MYMHLNVYVYVYAFVYAYVCICVLIGGVDNSIQLYFGKTECSINTITDPVLRLRHTHTQEHTHTIIKYDNCFPDQDDLEYHKPSQILILIK